MVRTRKRSYDPPSRPARRARIVKPAQGLPSEVWSHILGFLEAPRYPESVFWVGRLGLRTLVQAFGLEFLISSALNGSVPLGALLPHVAELLPAEREGFAWATFHLMEPPHVAFMKVNGVTFDSVDYLDKAVTHDKVKLIETLMHNFFIDTLFDRILHDYRLDSPVIFRYFEFFTEDQQEVLIHKAATYGCLELYKRYIKDEMRLALLRTLVQTEMHERTIAWLVEGMKDEFELDLSEDEDINRVLLQSPLLRLDYEWAEDAYNLGFRDKAKSAIMNFDGSVPNHMFCCFQAVRNDDREFLLFAAEHFGGVHHQMVKSALSDNKVELASLLAPFIHESMHSEYLTKAMDMSDNRFLTSLLPLCDEDAIEEALHETRRFNSGFDALVSMTLSRMSHDVLLRESCRHRALASVDLLIAKGNLSRESVVEGLCIAMEYDTYSERILVSLARNTEFRGVVDDAVALECIEKKVFTIRHALDTLLPFMETTHTRVMDLALRRGSRSILRRVLHKVTCTPEVLMRVIKLGWTDMLRPVCARLRNQ